MARDTATKGLVMIGLYFLILSVVFTTVAFIENEFNLTDSGFTVSGQSDFAFIDGGFCSAPRFNFETNSINPAINWGVRAGVERLNRDPRYSTLFDKGYIPDEATCDLYAGCVWEVSKRFIWFGETTEKATGTIDLPFYNNGNPFPVSVSFLGYINTSLLELEQFQESAVVCESFGFEWVEEDVFTDTSFSSGGIFSTFTSILRTLFDVTTLRVSFGNIPTVLNVLIIFIFIWVPLLLFFGYIFVMLR